MSKVSKTGKTAKVSKTKAEPLWYAVEAFTDGATEQQVAEVNANGTARPVLLQSQFYDRDGARLLQVVAVDMETVAPQDLEHLRKLLQAQGIVPTLVLPDKGVKFMKLRKLSPVEAKRLKESIKRQMAEARKEQA
jgi:hypothetical protein